MQYKKIIHSFFILFVVLAVCVVLGGEKVGPVSAGNLDDSRGYAWGDNIGWISANNVTDTTSHDYGVTVDGGGSLSGEVWSDNIGWIKFDPSYTGADGSDPYGARIIGNSVTGWAKACNAFINNACSGALRGAGEWDGWIKFTNVTIKDEIYLQGAVWGGFMDGGRLVYLPGWIDVSGMCIGGTDCAIGSAAITTTLEGKNAGVPEAYRIGMIEITEEAQRIQGVDIRWNALGDNKRCYQVVYSVNGGSDINLGWAPGGSVDGGQKILPNLVNNSLYTFKYSCDDVTTGRSVSPPPFSVKVAVGGGAALCSGNPYGSEVLEDTTRTIAYNACPGDSVGPGSWSEVSTCSASRCEYTRSIMCKLGYTRVGTECRLTPQYEEF